MDGPTADRVRVDLPAGPTDVSIGISAPAEPWAVAGLAHGAGAGMQHPFLVGFADALAAEGVAVVRFAFPYSEAGRRMPGPAPHAVATWRAVTRRMTELLPGLPVVAMGKSYGGRMASTAAAEGVISPGALVYLGYPLHPPGRPDKPRVEHLPLVTAPQIFVEGSNDPFIDPHAQLEEAVESCRDARIVWIEGGGHSFEVKGSRAPAEEVGAALAPLVARELRQALGYRPAA
ncbi:alpha/beta family hydrolase [Microbacterium sp. 1P10UB]|uniref:alpha/beta hydrolase family protein n=1 Tax=unclassified Microbacterium TaxID=2609290 RepID=UPI0039A14EE0